MSFGGSSSEEGGDKQSKRRDHVRKTETVKQKKTKKRADNKFFLTDQIATESEALHGELGATRQTRHKHERGREEAFRQKVSNLKSLLL